eukprot:COSAG02_NODE_3160_length_7253_cov_17.821778_2_plen_1312_part_00
MPSMDVSGDGFASKIGRAKTEEGALLFVNRISCDRCSGRCSGSRWVRRGGNQAPVSVATAAAVTGGDGGDTEDGGDLPPQFGPPVNDAPSAHADERTLCCVCVDTASSDGSWTAEEWVETSPFDLAVRRVRGSTVFETCRRAFHLHRAQPMLGTRIRMEGDGDSQDRKLSDHYVWLSYCDVEQWVVAFGSGLRRLGVMQGESVALCFTNRIEWVVADLALLFFGIRCVPCHVDWDRDSLKRALELTTAVAVVSDIDLVAELKTELSNLRLLVRVGDRFRHSDTLAKSCQQSRISTFMESFAALPPPADLLPVQSTTDAAPGHTMSAIEVDYDSVTRIGLAEPHELTPQTDPEAIYQLFFSSGSTGCPKAAMLSNDAFNRKVTRAKVAVCGHVTVSFEPLAHSDRSNVYSSIVTREAVAFYSGDVARVFEDIRVARPTTLSAVPRVWHELHTQYQSLLRAVVDLAKNDGHGKFLQPAHVESIVLAKFRERLGNRLEHINSGGAQVPDRLVRWLRSCFGCQVSVSYGCSECSGISIDGRLSEGVDVKLEAWGDYSPADTPHPRGVLLVKHIYMARGYLGDSHTEDDSGEGDAFDAEGYFRTGDVVELRTLPDGARHITILDRSKSLFKLQQGEHVSPERLEGVFQASQHVHQIWVHGDSTAAFPVAVVVASSSSSTQQMPEAEAEEMILQDLAQLANDGGLQRYEILQSVHVLRSCCDCGGREAGGAAGTGGGDGFTALNGLCTVTGKLCRRKLRERFRADLRACYERGSARLARAEDKIAQTVLELLSSASGAADLSKAQLQGLDLAALGLDSLAAARLQKRLAQAFGVKLAISSLYSIRSLQDLAPLLAAPGVRVNDNVTSNITSILADCQTFCKAHLGPSLADQISTQPVDCEDSSVVVLLTGGTGFVGAHILAALMKFTAWRVLCLVRGNSGVERLQSKLQEFGAIVNEADLHSRCEIVAGDLADADIATGLSTLGFRVVYHSAAWVHHLNPYEQLREANVLGTYRLLRAAQEKLPPARFHFVSTISVLNCEEDPRNLVESAELKGVQLDVANGYLSSKWVAEKLVLAQAALVNPSIYRLGTISGHSNTGACNVKDTLPCLLLAFAALQLVPSKDASGGLELLPVDETAETIVKLSLLPHATSSTAATQGAGARIYNLVGHATSIVSLKTVLKALRTWGFRDAKDCYWGEFFAAATRESEQGRLRCLEQLSFVASHYAAHTCFTGKQPGYASSEETIVACKRALADTASVVPLGRAEDGTSGTSTTDFTGTCQVEAPVSKVERLIWAHLEFFAAIGLLEPPATDVATSI